jgi:3'(2'), 5'-bisphosphate nucleotidase
VIHRTGSACQYGVREHVNGPRDDKTADWRLAERLTEVAIAASAAILAVDFRDCGARLKADNSPISRADEAAHAAIADGLARVAPGIAVISEEAAADWHGRTPPDEVLLVDPLDGTVEFLAGRLEYTVNIALVRGGKPVVGVIAAPALGLMWRGAIDHGAERLSFTAGEEVSTNAERIRTRPWPDGECVAAVSRSHFDAVTKAFLERVAPVRPLAAGSALKFCRVAEGAVDVYPRLAPTSEWDVAAGHAIVVAAGGAVFAAGGGALRYGRAAERFRVAGFTAWGDGAAARRILG